MSFAHAFTVLPGQIGNILEELDVIRSGKRYLTFLSLPLCMSGTIAEEEEKI
jgi:hypothetical protein